MDLHRLWNFCAIILGWFAVFSAVSLLVGIYYTYVLEFCIFTVTSLAEKVIYMVFYHIFFIMLAWSYGMTILNRPATPSKEFDLSDIEQGQFVRQEKQDFHQDILQCIAKELPIYTVTKNGNIRYCRICNLMMPDRCYHCLACNKCVLKHYSHCFLVNNCVGFSNYKYYFQLLFYVMLHCLFVCTTGLQYAMKFWTQELPYTDAKYPILYMVGVNAVLLLFIVPIFIYHCWLVGKNRTSAENCKPLFFRNIPTNMGFSLGLSKNLKEVFGEEKKYWLLPVYTRKGDGCSFPTGYERENPEQNGIDF
ncbi:palmitoyltransferase ZDHHC20-like [Xenopus laevis]|uniref:Palmitoyltransferase n=1 Tax=Xenopus laevis TaxID=8355 RepID=A0A8J1M893_XENLA|nr:palmitoyltransferase ZDHHC20-like [Xenopus laevis]XP_041437856.1 palmitoyltransferase ZDHHC20-like [Xenopus laevis]XP_041437857.1 palmitoyltransferase ZDHHC20-like [Xenopus laevis]XP_041437859.1 palmitoyltransferase ZDHHC20-like [Xenopus laevis]XP_041437860.1 palmitoyltransferase ZDHHC20-like [Xenopus laevis]XP_041437861.1 palmitoyltransferase ZDHHC20-like [Xenopus laevis]XP_041437863.1 palmitoyltransferase ZDHHC20-like [Xenopus laevis]XP_041437868.1 palmitoyltransferase ZDHHC20-like [Xen